MDATRQRYFTKEMVLIQPGNEFLSAFIPGTGSAAALSQTSYSPRNNPQIRYKLT